MKKGLKIGLIIVGSFLSLFAIDLTVSLIYKKAAETTETYQFKEDFHKIAVDVSTSDVQFIKSSGKNVKIICKETKNQKHKVKVENDTLKIDFDYKYYFNFLMFSPDFKVEVYVPCNISYELDLVHSTGEIITRPTCEFSNVNIKGSTGDVRFFANTIGTLHIESSTGDIFLSHNTIGGAIEIKTTTGSQNFEEVLCISRFSLTSTTGSKIFKNVETWGIDIDSTTGSTLLDNVNISKILRIHSTTGDVNIKKSDAKEIDIKTTTGDIDAEFLTKKIVYAKSRTGSIDVPKSTKGDLCTIETTIGDIKVTFAK